MLKQPIDPKPFDHALGKSSFREMQALEIEIDRAGKAAEYGYRLGVDDWSGDVDALTVRTGRAGRFRKAREEPADPALRASRYPMTSRAIRHRAEMPG